MTVIRPARGDKRKYLSLLLEADPSREMLEGYLDAGELYVLEEDGTAACVAVVLPLEDGTCELKNLATQAGLRGRGHAGAMVEWLCRRYARRFVAIVVGTSGYGTSFYTRLGFQPSHTVEHFFTHNYPAPLYDEDGSLCDHMYYLRRTLHPGTVDFSLLKW